MQRCSLVASACLALAAPAWVHAQIVRPIPTDSLRGEVVFGQPPEVKLNGLNARLAPGARIRSTDNMLILSGALAGQKLTVNYTVDTYGLLMNVWLLRADEVKQLWPKTATEAATWAYDPIAKTWTKP